MYFRFNNTTDDFGVTTETGIDWVYGNVAIHQYEHTPINVQDLNAQQVSK